METPSFLGPVAAQVEQLVSRKLGRRWTARQVRDLRDLACHPCAILSDGHHRVFAKHSDAPDGRRQFEVELAGLERLAATGLLTPTPVGLVETDGGCLLVLEAVEPVRRGPRQWREIGQALARLHGVTGDRFGLEQHGYIGPLPQDNTPADDWPVFFVTRRLEPVLRLAVDSGHLPEAVARRVERLLPRVPELCGPPVQPTLLHGDAQQNNWISTAAGAVAIDPAVHHGHPELDLAFLGCWAAVPEEVYDGYRELRPIDPGWPARRDLWRLWPYLGGVTIEGEWPLRRLLQALDSLRA